MDDVTKENVTKLYEKNIVNIKILQIRRSVPHHCTGPFQEKRRALLKSFWSYFVDVLHFDTRTVDLDSSNNEAVLVRHPHFILAVELC